jgi:hypothetical protein
VKVYGGVEFEPVNVTLGCPPFSHTVEVPEITAIGNVVTTMVMFVGTAQVAGAADVGVKVYGVEPGEVVLIVVGDQEPAIPLLEVVGKASGVAP